VLSIVLIDEVLRLLPGGSQSVLGRSNNDHYIVKCPYNQQGPNVLANEFLGTQLMAALGMPTPGWCFAQFRIPQDCPQCAERGLLSGHRPLHFASAMLTSISGSLAYFSVPRSHFSRIENRTDFLKAFIFDIWAGSTDGRQAIFVEDANRHRYRAFFIDHGHLFGGPYWNSLPRRGIALSRDTAIYAGLVNGDYIDDFLCQMKDVIPGVLSLIFASLPAEWRSAGTFWLEEALLTRLPTVRHKILSEVGFMFKASSHFSTSLICA